MQTLKLKASKTAQAFGKRSAMILMNANYNLLKVLKTIQTNGH
jgi:hypothetical protein